MGNLAVPYRESLTTWGEEPFFHPLRHQENFSYGADSRVLPWVLPAKKFS